MSLDYDVSCIIQYYTFNIHIVVLGSHISGQAQFPSLHDGRKLE